MPIQTLLTQILILFAVAGIGLIAQKKNVLNEAVQSSMRTMMLSIALPFNILSSAKIAAEKGLRSNMLIMLGMAAAYFLIVMAGTLLLAGIFKLNGKRRAVFAVSITLANAGFIGLPICTALYGDQGTFYASLYNLISTSVTWTFGVSLLSGEKSMNLRKILVNPNTIASLIVIVLVCAGWALPPIISNVAAMVGNMTTPLAMLLLGAAVAQIKFSEIAQDRFCYLVSFFRLLAIPLALAFALARMPVDSLIKMCMLIGASVSCGMINGILAAQYDCESMLMSKTIVHSTAFLIGTLPIVLWMGAKLFA